jgi:agmatine deiminase
MPAEWAVHRATWLSWPHNLGTWPTSLEKVRSGWIRLIELLSPHEQVCLLVNNDQTNQDVELRLKSSAAVTEHVSIVNIPTVDVWIRDYGPTFVLGDKETDPLALNDWIFNGWGGKYKDYEQDDRVAREIARRLETPVFEHPVVLEGGSIEVNGRGTCLTTEQCLLNENRNPHLSRAEIEQFLMRSLGVDHVVWLGEGIAGDDTDGHIDDIARFVDSTTVVCSLEANPKDENYAALRANFERLQGARDEGGRKLNVVALPCPAPVFCDGSRLPASYANFYIANELVVVPTFDDPRDEEAVGILQELFPDRKAVGVDCRQIVEGLGGIHCVTQQEPKILLFRA